MSIDNIIHIHNLKNFKINEEGGISTSREYRKGKEISHTIIPQMLFKIKSGKSMYKNPVVCFSSQFFLCFHKIF